jgi:hypothetical protein
MSTTRVYKLTPHAERRCFDERVEPRDVLAALEGAHRIRRNATNAYDHFVNIGGTEFRVVASGRGVVLTLHRRIKDRRLRREFRDVSRKTRKLRRRRGKH